MLAQLMPMLFGGSSRSDEFEVFTDLGVVKVPSEFLQSHATTGRELAKAMQHLNVFPDKAVFRGVRKSTLSPEMTFGAAEYLMSLEPNCSYLKLVRITPDNFVRVLNLAVAIVIHPRDSLERMQIANNAGGMRTLTIEWQGAMVGLINFHESDEKSNDTVVVDSILIDARLRQRGFASRALQLFTQYAHACYSEKKFVQCIARDDEASIRMLRKAGFSNQSGTMVYFSPLPVCLTRTVPITH